MVYPDDSYEKKYRNGNVIVAGLDEAGRGPLAGPVVAAAVILPDNLKDIDGLNDSKKLSEKKREELYTVITEKSVSYASVFISPEKIDEINILQASCLAMKLAAEKLRPRPGHLLIDGNYFKDFGVPFTTIVKGDSKSVSIAAASIVAKVERDRWMRDVAENIYPEYGFARHKGYGTKQHRQAIEKYGACPIHRRTFIKKYSDDEPSLFDGISF